MSLDEIGGYLRHSLMAFFTPLLLVALHFLPTSLDNNVQCPAQNSENEREFLEKASSLLDQATWDTGKN
jgi:hypothetical protein